MGQATNASIFQPINRRLIWLGHGRFNKFLSVLTKKNFEINLKNTVSASIS